MILFWLVLGCEDITPSVSDASRKTIILPDTTGNKRAQVEHDIYSTNKKITTQLSLSDISVNKDSLEIRFWVAPALYGPIQLYILKCRDSVWSLTQNLIYLKTFDPEKDDYRKWDGYKNPFVDSVFIRQLKPVGVSWDNYIDQLKIDSLWTLKSQSEFDGKFGALDGISYSLEISDRQRYKFVHYNNPYSHTDEDESHRRIMEFEGKLFYKLNLEGVR